MATVKHTRPKSGHLRSVPSTTDPEAFLASVERLKEFNETPQGKALTVTEDEVSTAVALLETAIRSLEQDDGNESETVVLNLALERLRAAQEHLDAAATAARRAAEESQS